MSAYPMSEEADNTHIDDESSELIGYVIENKQSILKHKDGISINFEENIGSDDKVDVFSTLGTELESTLRPTIDDDETRTDVINGLYRLVLNYESGAAEELYDQSSDSEFLSFMNLLSSKYTRKFRQRANRQSRGRNWWSDVKTNIGLRSGSFYIENELVIDMSDIVVFSSGLNEQVTLSDHLLSQIMRTKNEFGEEALESVNKDAVQRLSDRADNLLDEMNEYEEKYDVDLSGATGTELVNDESGDPSEE